MTREDILTEILALKGQNWLLELATGTGKSRIAIEKVKQLTLSVNSIVRSYAKILIVVPRNVHKKNWEDEIKKWWPKCPFSISYTTYVSFPKHKGDWDIIIFDECHHLSERCREALCDFNVGHSILLSATVSNNLKDELKEVFEDLVSYKKDLRDVIEDEILPDPDVYLIPLELGNDYPTESMWYNKGSKKKLIECSWAERWNYIRQKEYPVRVYCTQRQYLTDLNNQIEYWKKRYMRTKNPITRNKWLKLCGDRLKWLSDKKTAIIQQILVKLSEHRTITFCNSIEQTNLLGEYCINSKNKNSLANLKAFNRGEIDHITACNMLNEGMNLVNCRIGIYANLNSSETIIKQRMGRLLRHPNPILIVPYFTNSREEELVQKMLEDYNPALVTILASTNKLSI